MAGPLTPLLALLAPLLTLPGILAFRNHPNAREASTFVPALFQLAVVFSLVVPILGGERSELVLVQLLPGVPLSLRVDGLGLLFALVASSLWIVTTIYSMGYMRALDEHAQTRYYCYFALALFATVGVAFAANLLTLYLFYELLSLSTYPLVTHHQDQEAKSAGRKYLVYILGGSIGLALPAIIVVYLLTGTLDFTGTALPAPGWLQTLLLLMFLFGFSKAGLMPVHSWLPGAMVAPTPVSALLHAVAVVKVGVFSVIRVLTGTFGPSALLELGLRDVLLGITAFTVMTAAVIMASQDNLKRCLAFSTVGQLAYILMSVSLLTPLGVTAGALHIALHAFGKITLFFCAGAIYVTAHKTKISQMAGLGRRMPLTMGAFFVGTLSIVGLPPAAGFDSKWLMLTAAAQEGQLAVMAVIVGSSFVKAATLFPIVYRAYFLPPPDRDDHGEAPLLCLIPLLFTAAASLALFLYPQPFLALAQTFVSGDWR